MCNASNYIVGAVLGQQKKKKRHVNCYVSRTLNSAQCNYSATEKKFLAIVFVLDKFRSYLLGSKVIVFFFWSCCPQIFTSKEGIQTETHMLDSFIARVLFGNQGSKRSWQLCGRLFEQTYAWIRIIVIAETFPDE
jgi:hypothetical protein